jgi:hypothetical protein
MRVTVIGLKRFVGVVDGKSISSGKIFCQVKLDESRNTDTQASRGFAAEELRVDPEIIKRIEHNPLPFVADLDTERVSNGKESREVVLDVRPVKLAPVPAKAAA